MDLGSDAGNYNMSNNMRGINERWQNVCNNRTQKAMELFRGILHIRFAVSTLFFLNG